MTTLDNHSDQYAVSRQLALEAEKSQQSYAIRIWHDAAIDWIVRADAVAKVFPDGPHAEYNHIYWTAYLNWDNEENIDLGETTRQQLGAALKTLLDNSLIGLREDVWRKNRLDKGLHLINVATAFETFIESKEPCDALQRILQDGSWDPVPMLELLYATEQKQRESLKLTTNVTSRWTWESHPYWLLLKQLSVHTALGVYPGPGGIHSERMWRVAPIFDFKHPMRAVTTLAHAVPHSFPEALDFYTQYNYRMSPKTPGAIFKMDLKQADSVLAVQAVMKMVAYQAKYKHCEKGMAWLDKKLPELADALHSSASLGLLAEDIPTQASYWLPLWNKVVHGQALDVAILPEQFDCAVVPGLLK